MRNGPSPAELGVQPSASRIIAFSSIVGAMTVFGQTAGISVFVDSLIADLSVSRAEVSSVYSVGSLVAAFAMPWVGRAIDQHGTRRAALVVGAVFGTAIIALSQVGGLIALALGFFAVRLLGQGALSLTAKVVVALRFRVNLGRAVGLTGALIAVGLAVLPIVLSNGIGHLGWRLTWILGGVAVWVVVIPMTLWALPLGADRAMLAAGSRSSDDAPEEWTRARAVRTGIFWAITLAVAANSLVITGLTFHQIGILGAAGLSPARAAANFLPQTIASVAALAFVGVLADRLPGRAMLLLSMVLLALATSIVQFLADGWLPIAYGLLLGAAGGTSNAAEGVLYPRYFGVRAIASIRGLGFTLSIGAAAAGPILVGVTYQMSGGYGLAGLIFLAMPVAVGVVTLVVRDRARAVG